MRELFDLDVLIVDCQTTGASPAFGAILELGWCVANASRPAPIDLQAHWVALPAGHRVSAQVRRLTGFDERLGADALGPEDAWSRLRASMPSDGAMPAAIHFARFELAFLRDWASRFSPAEAFPIDAICVHALACRLYPDLPRRTIRALAGFLGHGLDLARRSLGHVEATAFIWQKLSRELADRGVRDWDALRAFLAEKAPGGARGKRRYPLPRSRCRELPDASGVYRFVRSNGDVLYVGKATSLRQRVASHFSAATTREHALEMLTQVSDVQVTLTPSPLEAALLENESIKSLCPPYNVQLVGADRRAWFSAENFDAVSPTADDVHRIGPLPSELSLSSLGALIALVAGAPSTPLLRGRALGTSAYWAPDAGVFAAGFADFVARHLGERSGCAPRPRDSSAPPPSARRAVLDAGKKLLALSKPAPAAEESAPAEPDARAWDPERVTRHLERNASQAYQLFRRAGWLCLLYDSAIAYREPESDRTRLLALGAGELLEAREHRAGEPVSIRASAPSLRARQNAFDRAKYDRLRILTTELKRVRRDGGSVTVYVGRGRRLEGGVLDGILRWV